jgi:hypothetical protein
MAAHHVGKKILNNAISQAERLLGAPSPEAVAVDDRSLAQLIAFAANYGGLIRFYDLDDRPDGTWAGIFAADPAVGHALHAALDLPEIERILQQLLAEARAAIDHKRRHHPVRRIFAVLTRLMGILDRADIGAQDAEAMIRRFAPQQRRDGLGDPLRRLSGHLSQLTLEEGLRRDADGRDPEWRGTLYDILDDFVATMIGELRNGASAARRALDKALATGKHEPNAAIYNAFVKLFIESRATLNQFPQRMVDFYYDEVLKQHTLDAVPDQLFLTFTAAPTADQVSVRRGTLFSAGTDAQGAAINYSATTSLEVTQAVVSELSVHRVTNASLGGYMVPTGVLTGTVALDPSNPTAVLSFPLFGGDDEEPVGALTMQRASLGFCIASPLLMLRGGTRRVEIGLVVSRAIPRMPGEKITSEDDIDLLAALIEKSLQLHYSTAGGWMLIQPFHVTSDLVLGSLNEAAHFTIAFELPPDAPPLVALSEKSPANAPPPSQPATAFLSTPLQPAIVASIDLAGADQPGAFSLLAHIAFEHIFLDVHVEGLDALTLTTPNGPADTSQNFPLFGLPPAQHSELEIYAPELFVKPIDRLTASVSWVGLPVTSTGFQGYYQNYTLDADGKVSPTPLFDNTSFRVAFSVVNPGYWDVSQGPDPYLFQTGPGATPAATPPVSGAYADLAAPAPDAPVLRTSLLGVPGLVPQTAPPYYKSETSALRLTLTEPSYAFGNILYSSNLMAASLSQSAAAVKAARGSRDVSESGAPAQVANLTTVNATAPDRSYAKSVSTAAHAAISSLTGEAMAAIQQGVAQTGAAPESQAWWLTDLEKALSAAVASHKGSLWDRLLGRGGKVADAAAVVDGLRAWIAQHEQSLGGLAAAALGRAKALLAAAENVATTHAASADQPVSVARPSLAAASQQAQAAVLPPALPNPPWLPMASALTIAYSASADSAITDPATTPPSGSAMSTPVATAGEANPLDLDFWHIGPFGVLKGANADPKMGVGILPKIEGEAALYILLSAQVPQISLLFMLAAGPDGWWDDPPRMIWEEYIDEAWKPLTVYDDTTKQLQNSGIVTLAPTVIADKTKVPRLRVRAEGKTEGAPYVQAVVANALAAKWEGPGGDAGLGTPLPAGTITKSLNPLAGVASIAQPMQSFGGSPPLVGAAFQMWMAERLRHKGFAIDAWDYARIVLAAVPSLWQAAVVPATDAKTGARAPGQVWVVAVAGPSTPNVTDKTVPQVDLATLSEIGDTLNGCVGDFTEVVVTNPPYLRLAVTAEVEFTADDTSTFWEDQLGAELVEWLSPWPPSASLGPRPANYYTRRAVAEFIRGRSYVLGITSLEIRPEDVSGGHGWHYLTSAAKHAITTAKPGGLELPAQDELYPADAGA